MDMLKQLRRTAIFKVGCVLLVVALMQGTAAASPFGQGVFGADVPFGSDTSLSINLGSNVSLSLTPSGGFYTGSASHTVTVTSTDVVGYVLYVHALGSTDMTGASTTIPVSGNTTDAALSTNTWGYNTTGSTTNFTGMTTYSTAIKTATGPYKSGDPTTVTYGAKTSVTQAAGAYQISVVYTAVASNP